MTNGELPKQEIKMVNEPILIERRLKIEKDFKPIAKIVASEDLFNPDIEFFGYIDAIFDKYNMDSFFSRSDLLAHLRSLAEFLVLHTSPDKSINPCDKKLTKELLALRKNFVEEYKRMFLDTF